VFRRADDHVGIERSHGLEIERVTCVDRIADQAVDVEIVVVDRDIALRIAQLFQRSAHRVAFRIRRAFIEIRKSEKRLETGEAPQNIVRRCHIPDESLAAYIVKVGVRVGMVGDDVSGIGIVVHALKRGVIDPRRNREEHDRPGIAFLQGLDNFSGALFATQNSGVGERRIIEGKGQALRPAAMLCMGWPGRRGSVLHDQLFKSLDDRFKQPA
jgi:hypothetical protein